MGTPVRRFGRFSLPALRWSRTALGVLLTLMAFHCALASRGATALAVNYCFALAGIAGLWLRSWPVLGAVVGAFGGGVAGASLGDSSVNAPLNGLLFAVCGAVVGYCLQALEGRADSR